MDAAGGAQELHGTAHDFVAVLSLLHKHPVADDQALLMLSHLAELAARQSFREWFAAEVAPDTARALADNVLRVWHVAEALAPSPAAQALRALCACSPAVQLETVGPRGLPLLCTKLSSGSQLAAQCLSNAVTRNSDAAATLLDSPLFAEASAAYAAKAARGNTKAATLCTLLHNAWVACGRGSELAAQLLPTLERHTEDMAGVACVMRCIVASPAVAASLPTCVAWFACAQAFPAEVLGSAGVAARLPTLWWDLRAVGQDEFGESLNALAMACASEDEPVRRGCAIMAQARRPSFFFFFALNRLDKNGLLEHCCELLDDAAFLRPDLVLQLLGNVVYRNDEAICLRLLALDAFTKVLQHARFHPEAGLTREWAMVVIRNATEVSPAVHQSLSQLQLLGLDRTNDAVQLMERQLGAKLHLSSNGKISVAAPPRTRHVAIVTCQQFASLVSEDVLLSNALTERGCEVHAVVWTDPSFFARKWDVALVHTVWDYHHQPERFLAWLQRCQDEAVPLVNPVQLLRWNMHKAYMEELASRCHVPCIPTRVLRAGTKVSLAKEAALVGDCKFYVIKPCVGASGAGVLKFALNDDKRARELQARTDCLLQPFVPSICTRGELSLVFFGGVFSHCVCKVPPRGDFKVQCGVETLVAKPDEAALRVGRDAVAAQPYPSAYTRVDVVWFGEQYVVSELECLDPEVFLLKCSQPAAAAERFADAVLATNPGLSEGVSFPQLGVRSGKTH